MLDQPDQQERGSSDPSPTQLHGSYPPQHFDGQQQQRGQQEYYAQQGYAPQLPQQQVQYAPAQQQQQQPLMQGQQAPQRQQQQQQQGNGGGPFAMGQVINPNDPMLDEDPFGLSASMHYPTSYSGIGQHQQGPGR
jgi:hypothetical protein